MDHVLAFLFLNVIPRNVWNIFQAFAESVVIVSGTNQLPIGSNGRAAYFQRTPSSIGFVLGSGSI